MARKIGQATDYQRNVQTNVVLHPSGSAPSTPVDGSVWYDTGTDEFKIYDGVGWDVIGPSAASFAAPTATIQAGDAAAAGAAGTAIRSDAQFAVETAAAEAVSGANGEGNSTALARADHDHALAADIVTATILRDSVGTDGDRAVTTDHVRDANITLAKLASDVTAYIADRAGGLDPKGSVRVVTTSNVTVASPGASHDGLTIVSTERMLLAGQSDTTQNGIWVFNGAASPLTRPTDADSAGDLSGGSFTWVEEGTAGADTGWIITTNGSITPGTTAHAWTQFSGAGQITAGAGLTKNGNTIDAVGTASRITVAADAIDISSAYVGQATIVTVGTITTGTWTGTDIAIADGGTGASTAATARENLGGGATTAVPRKFSVAYGDGGATSYNIDHNLGTDDVIVSVRKVSNGDIWEVEAVVSTTNRVIVTHGTVPTTNEFECTVVG